MSTTLAPFPDAELVAMDLLDPFGDTVTATPTQLPPGLIQVERIGGADDGVTDRPLIRVTCFGVSRVAAWNMTRATQQAVLAAGGTMVTGSNTAAEYPKGVLIDKTRTASPPKQVPESGRGSRQIETVYEIHMRRPWW